MTTESGVPVVLFVCIQNAGRSQMAEAIFNHLAEGRALARSAGSRPAASVHPVVAEALAEIGLDVAGSKPKGLELAVLDGADVVVGMGCGDECPYVPGAMQVEWDVPDPSGLSLNEVRGIRKEIARRVDLLYRDVLGEGAAAASPFGDLP